MRNLNKALVLFLWIILCSFSYHKFYVSLIQIDYSSKEKTLQSSIKVFTDDMKKALGDKYEISKKGNDSLNKALFNYGSEHLKLKQDKIPVKWNWVGYELDEDVIWLYIESDKLKTQPKSIEVNCTNLIDFFEDQVNIIQVKIGETRKSKSLTRSETKSVFEF